MSMPGESHGQKSLVGYSLWDHKSRSWHSSWTTTKKLRREYLGIFKTLSNMTTKFWSPKKYIFNTVMLSLGLTFAASLVLLPWWPRSHLTVSDHGCLLTFVLLSIKCWMNPRQRSPSPPLFPVILLSVACVCFLGMQCFNPKFCSKLRDFSPHGRPGAEVCVRVAI